MMLTKLSSPGWKRLFSNKCELQAELFTHICQQCRAEEGISSISDIDDMLNTPCGCEYWVDEENE